MNSLQAQTLKLETATIEFNYEDIAKDLTDKLKHYEGLVFTEENTTELRSTLAELRKGKTSVDSYRKEIKKKLNQPVLEFEEKCKSLNKQFDDVINPLKEQLDQYEERRKEEKRVEIQAFIDKTVKDYELEDEYSSQIVVENEYLNKSARMSATEDTIKFRAENFKMEQDKTKNEKRLIEGTVKVVNVENNLSFSAEPYIRLLEFKDVDSIIEQINNDSDKEVSRIKAELERKERAEEKRKNEEEQRIKRETEVKEVEPVTEVEFSPIVEDIQFDDPFADDTEFESMPDPFLKIEPKEVKYTVVAFDEQHAEIKNYLTNMGVLVNE